MLWLWLLLAAPVPRVEITETGPLGSELDRPSVRNALDVFPGLFAEAESTRDIAQMYMFYFPPQSGAGLCTRSTTASSPRPSAGCGCGPCSTR